VVAAASALAWGLTACGSPGSGGTLTGQIATDAGLDAAALSDTTSDSAGTADAPLDTAAPPDAVTDATPDAVAPPDAVTDATPDAVAPPDAVTDAAPDTVTPPDTVTDAAPDTVTPPDTVTDAAPDTGPCVPDCAFHPCGDDGCGGSCGTCPDGQTCSDQGLCIATPSCGDVTKIGCCDGATLWACEGGAAVATSCQGTPSCGWDAAQGGYACGTDGQASPDGAYVKDCPWVCTPDCTGKVCGDDGCGGACGTCADGQVCTDAGQCAAAPSCGDVTKVGCCDGETLWTCEGGEAVQTSCVGAPSCGWDETQGGYACGTDGQASPDGSFPRDCAWMCYPNCDGRECGDDGCGGSCGTCEGGAVCTPGGQCCAPSCDGKSCGGDGCGGSCGTCEAGSVCNTDGQCVVGCAPDCEGKECGPNGCGGVCGVCEGAQVCNSAGSCVDSCTPDCGVGGSNACGDDGCGGSCGSCPAGATCDQVTHLCVPGCTPDCAPNGVPAQCGDDGCGGSCGTCDAGLLCTLGGQCGNECVSCSFAPQCLSMGFESATLVGWQLEGDAKIVPSFGAAVPPEGGQMLDVSNALADEGRASTQTCVPSTTSGVRFRWKFYSEEFLEYCGSAFADYFRVRIAVGDASTGEQTVFERTVNDLCAPTDGSCSTTTCGAHALPLEPADVAFDYGDVYMTKWQTAFVPLDGLLVASAPSVLTISFVVGDTGDSVFATHVLIDGVTFLDNCTPNCTADPCGDDGCGGACTICDPGGICQDGACQCTPDCTGKVCGDDGCGGSCGSCQGTDVCYAGACVACAPQCTGKVCGDDGCGGSCGSCAPDQTCSAGACVDQGDFGDPCTGDGDCLDGKTCQLSFPFGGSSICTEPCDPNNPTNCPSGWSCLPSFTTGGDYCSPFSNGGGPGGA